LHGNKTKSHSDLARHYQEIGIAAAACAGARLAAVVPESNRERKIVQRRKPMVDDGASNADRETRESLDNMTERGANATRG
jgi:hypothetical protein